MDLKQYISSQHAPPDIQERFKKLFELAGTLRKLGNTMAGGTVLLRAADMLEEIIGERKSLKPTPTQSSTANDAWTSLLESVSVGTALRNTTTDAGVCFWWTRPRTVIASAIFFAR